MKAWKRTFNSRLDDFIWKNRSNIVTFIGFEVMRIFIEQISMWWIKYRSLSLYIYIYIFIYLYLHLDSMAFFILEVVISSPTLNTFPVRKWRVSFWKLSFPPDTWFSHSESGGFHSGLFSQADTCFFFHTATNICLIWCTATHIWLIWYTART